MSSNQYIYSQKCFYSCRILISIHVEYHEDILHPFNVQQTPGMSLKLSKIVYIPLRQNPNIQGINTTSGIIRIITCESLGNGRCSVNPYRYHTICKTKFVFHYYVIIRNYYKYYISITEE